MIVDVVHDARARARRRSRTRSGSRESGRSRRAGASRSARRARNRRCVLEIAGPALEVVRPAPGATFLICANRYRSDALQAGQLAGTAGVGVALRAPRAPVARARRGAAPRRSRRRCSRGSSAIATMSMHRRASATSAAILAQGTNVHCAVVTPARCEAIVGIDRAPTCEGQWAEIAWQWDGPPARGSSAASESSGFRARVRDDIAAPHDAATRRCTTRRRPTTTITTSKATLAAIERAVAADPDDPSLRLPAAWLALEAKLADRAIVHVHAGLATETRAVPARSIAVVGRRAARTQDRALATRWTVGSPELGHRGAHARRRNGHFEAVRTSI